MLKNILPLTSSAFFIFSPLSTSMAKWLRRPPREQQTRGSIPFFCMGFFPGPVAAVPDA